MTGFSEVSLKVFKFHPYVFIFVVVIAALSLVHSYDTFAQKSDLAAAIKTTSAKFEDIGKRLTSLEVKVDVSFLEIRLNDTDAEIFALERIVASNEANQRDLNRLSKLRSDSFNMRRALTNLEQATGED